MARKHREFVANHITTDGSQQNRFLFLDSEDRNFYRLVAEAAADALGLTFLRLLLRPQGVLHLLRATQAEHISQYHCRVKAQYSRYLNRKYQREPQRLIENVPMGIPLQRFDPRITSRESNFRPRFHAVAVPENVWESIAEAGWTVEDTEQESVEVKTDTEYLWALECALEKTPTLPKPGDPLPPEFAQVPPLRAKNSPHWPMFLAVQRSRGDQFKAASASNEQDSIEVPATAKSKVPIGRATKQQTIEANGNPPGVATGCC
jgi:hypothetical protein